jgi:hypothetical protein
MAGRGVTVALTLLTARQGLSPALAAWAQATTPDRPWDLVFQRQGITLSPWLANEFHLPGDETLAAPGSYIESAPGAGASISFATEANLWAPPFES